MRSGVSLSVLIAKAFAREVRDPGFQTSIGMLTATQCPMISFLEVKLPMLEVVEVILTTQQDYAGAFQQHVMSLQMLVVARN